MKKLLTLCLCGFLVLGCSSTTNKKDEVDSNKDKTEEKNGKKTSKKEENKNETETDESTDSSENAVKENTATNETNSSTSTNQSTTGNNSNSSALTTPENNNSGSSNGSSNSGASNGNGNAGTETTNPPIEDTNYCMYLDLGVGNSGMSFSSIADSDTYLSETVFNPNSPHYLQHFTYRDHGCNPDGSKRYSIDWL